MSKIETAFEYNLDQIAYASGAVVDALSHAEIGATEMLGKKKDDWTYAINNGFPSNDLLAVGVRLRFQLGVKTTNAREQLEKTLQATPIHLQRRVYDIANSRWLEALSRDPRIHVIMNRDVLSDSEMTLLGSALDRVAEVFSLRIETDPPVVVFPKEQFARKIVYFDTDQLFLS